MTDGIPKASALLKARIAGGLWLIVIAAGMSAVSIRSTLITRNDAAATAASVLSSEPLFRLALGADLIAGACYMGVTVILYDLLVPVSTSMSLLAALFGASGVAVGAATSVAYLAPLLLLGGGPSVTAFSISQLQTLALMFVRLHGQGYSISMIFFGFQCLLLGSLIVRSTFLPRILGMLLAIGGLSYVISSFANILAPGLSAQLSPYILPLALVGEGSVSTWLLAMGVNVQSLAMHSSSAAERSWSGTTRQR